MNKNKIQVGDLVVVKYDDAGYYGVGLAARAGTLETGEAYTEVYWFKLERIGGFFPERLTKLEIPSEQR